MDTNGQRFWMLADEADWQVEGDPPRLAYNGSSRSLGLASRRKQAQPTLAASTARSRASSRRNRTPQTADQFGGRAWWDAESGCVLANGAFDSPVPILQIDAGEGPTDLCMGHDGILYVAVDGGIVMSDRRGRWSPVFIQATGFSAWRLAADPAGGVWVLENNDGRLARLTGTPMPDAVTIQSSPSVFRPSPENPNPPALSILEDSQVPDSEQAIAIASSPEGRIGILSWARGGRGRLRLLQEGVLGQPNQLLDIRFAYDLTWVSEERVAVLTPDAPKEAPAFDVPADNGVSGGVQTAPVGDLYPLRNHDGSPFVRGLVSPPHYPINRASAPLHKLSLPSYMGRGSASNGKVIDSGSQRTEWHRLYLEASLPAGCGVTVFLATSATNEPPDDDAAWFEHRFGPKFAVDQPSDVHERLPLGAWVPQPSELPFHPGLCRCEQVPEQAGLFTVLVQRTGRRVRTLGGRYLHVRLEMQGTGRSSPEIWALRAYGSRFSYRDQYLPALYKEQLFGPDADASVSAETPVSSADFLERFLDNFEGVLTPLEDRIASSYLLTDPRATPEDALPWLGSWIGVEFEQAHSAAQQRQLLAYAPELFKRRGTIKGLGLALDIATSGGVSGGEIVLVEDWRLRRTFATILGADLADESDPLTGGLTVSGNSYVGDTLWLGDENRKEFLSLFRADLAVSNREEDAIETFLDELAYRLTVLVHDHVADQDLGLIRRVVEAETPAHVEAKVVRARTPFLVGIAALVGVDSYLGRVRIPQQARISNSTIGHGDVIRRTAGLDPRLEGGRPEPDRISVLPPPTAVVAPEQTVMYGESFDLDASGSTAAPGRQIVEYRWRLVGKE